VLPGASGCWVLRGALQAPDDKSGRRSHKSDIASCQHQAPRSPLPHLAAPRSTL